jgi:lysophospholipase L1-like esterase
MTTLKKKKVVFFGDSITQMGVNKGGYIDKMQDLLREVNKPDQFELIGAGIGGNKVYDLYLRMEEDVLSKEPDIVVIYVGINDVWHKTSGTGTDLDKYEKFYIAIIKKLQAKNIKVILATPTVIGEKNDGTNPQDKDLDLYSNVVRKLATQLNCGLVDLRKTFSDYLQKQNTSNAESGILTTDRVHLNDKGNTMVAKEMLNALTKL